MRQVEDGILAAFASKFRADHVRVRIKDSSGSWVEYAELEDKDWVKQVVVEDSEDKPTMSGSVILKRDENEFLSLSPFNEYSKLNLLSGSFSPLLDIGREIEIFGTVGAGGDTDAFRTTDVSWVSVFCGYIDELDLGGSDNAMSLRCRDLGGYLLDTFIETQREYGSSGGTAIETVMQSILTDNSTGVTLYTPSSPGFAIKPFIQQKEPVLSALQKLADLIGWQVKYRWDSGTSAWRLTFYGPDRTKTTPDHSFGPDDYYSIQNARIQAGGIRNKVRVVYTASGGAGRNVYEVSDSASITKYGTRFMELAEDAASPIDTYAEAQDFGDAALADLKDPVLTHHVDLPGFFLVETGDLYTFEANDSYYTDDLDLAVFRWRTTWSKGVSKTVIGARGKPSSGYLKWLRYEARPGGNPTADFLGPVDKDKGKISRYTAEFGLGSFHISHYSEQPQVVMNRDFGYQSRITEGSGRPPDDWYMRSGTWGSTGDVFISDTVSQSGGRSIHFKNSVTTPVVMESEFFTVEQNFPYLGTFTIIGDTTDAANVFTMYVEWYDYSKTYISTATVNNAQPLASFGWQKPAPYSTYGIISPANAKFAKLVLTKTSNSVHNVWLDSIRFPRTKACFWAYKLGSQSIPVGTSYTVVDLSNIIIDYGAGVDTTNNLYNCYYPGVYHVQGLVTFSSAPSGTEIDVRLEQTQPGGAWVPIAYQNQVAGASEDVYCHINGMVTASLPYSVVAPTQIRLAVRHNYGSALSTTGDFAFTQLQGHQIISLD